MKTKLNKLIKLTAAGLFLIALALNIKVTLDDPFVMMSEQAIATGSTTGGTDGTETTDEEDCVEEGSFIMSHYGWENDIGTDCLDQYGEFCGTKYKCKEDKSLPELPSNQFAGCIPSWCI